MAKYNNEDFFVIDPESLVKDRAITFSVYVYLKLNQRVILFRPNGHPMDEIESIQKMQSKGLRFLFVLKTEMNAYLEYVKGTPFETTAEELLKRTAAELYGQNADDQSNAETDDGAQGDDSNQTANKGSKSTETIGGEKKEIDFETATDAEGAKEDDAAEDSSGSDSDKEKQPSKETPQEETPKAPPASPEKIMEGLLKPEPDNLPAIDQAKDMVLSILKSSPQGSAISDIVEGANTEHATSVAIYSALFAMALNKNEQTLLQDIIIASLLHDIGITQVSSDVVAIPALKQTGVQKELFHEHVKLGLDLLMDLDFVPNKRVMTLLHQHHEKFDGTGYPAHVDSFRVDELAQIISLADLIDGVSRGQYDGTKRSLDEALLVVAQIEKQSTFPEYFNPDIFRKVMNWIKKGGGQDYLAAAESAVNEAKQKLMKAG